MPDNKTVEKDSTAKIATKRMEISQEYTQPYFDRFLDNYKHYFLRVIDEAVEADSDAYPFYSQLMIPVSYQVVETILPRMFSRLPNFSIQTEEENDQADELAFQNLIKYQIQHPYLIDDPIFVRLMGALKETFITGNAWGTVPWYLKDIDTFEWQPYSLAMGIEQPDWNNLEKIQSYGQQPDWKMVKVKKRVIDAPVFEHKSIFHTFPDAKKKRVSQLGYIIFEDDMTREQIQDLINISPRDYKDVDKINDLDPISTTTSRGTNYDQELAAMFGSTDFSSRDDGTKQYKVWVMQEPDKYSIIINETLTIRESDNPNGDGKIGAFLMKDIPVPHDLYAWGEPDPIKKIEDSMSDQANMRNDAVFYDLLKMWEIDPSGLVDGEEFIPQPGTIVQVKTPGSIKMIDTGLTKQSAYKEYNEWEQVTQNISGASDYSTGQASPGMNKTLGGIELLQQAANARFSMKLQLFEQLGLKAMGSMYVQRNQRFFDTPQNVNGEKGKSQVTPEQLRRIRGTVHFIVDTGSTEAINQTTEQTKWKTVIDMIGKPPFDHLTPDGLNELAMNMLYALRISQAEEIMKPADPNDPNAQDGSPVPGFSADQVKGMIAVIQSVIAKSQPAAPADKANVSVSLRGDINSPEGQKILAKEGLHIDATGEDSATPTTDGGSAPADGNGAPPAPPTGGGAPSAPIPPAAGAEPGAGAADVANTQANDVLPPAPEATAPTVGV